MLSYLASLGAIGGSIAILLAAKHKGEHLWVGAVSLSPFNSGWKGEFVRGGAVERHQSQSEWMWSIWVSASNLRNSLLGDMHDVVVPKDCF